MDHAVRFNADATGLTTAENFTISTTSTSKAVGGTVAVLSIGAQRVCYRFGGANDTVTTSNGFRLPANSLVRVSVPPRATNIHFIRADGTDSDVSLQWADGGI